MKIITKIANLKIGDIVQFLKDNWHFIGMAVTGAVYGVTFGYKVYLNEKRHNELATKDSTAIYKIEKRLNILEK